VRRAPIDFFSFFLSYNKSLKRGVFGIMAFGSLWVTGMGYLI